MKKITLLMALCLMMTLPSLGQEKFPPTEVIVGEYIGKTIPLREYALLQNDEKRKYDVPYIVPNESRTPFEYVDTNTVIPDLQTEDGSIVTRAIEQNFIGASASEGGGGFPPDPTGAAGPNHYVHSVNSFVKIFDKTGNLEVGPVSLGSFLSIPSNFGDPIVLYDQLADRWLVSEFGNLNAGNTLAIGVSETNDPGGAYNVYQYNFSGLPDYPKYGVWHDGYYATINLAGQTTRGFVVERDVMLAGGTDPQIFLFALPDVVVNPNQVKSPEPVNLLGTSIDTDAPGYIVYLQDDGWTSQITFDHLKVWEIDVDWDNASNSTVSSPLVIPTDPFDSGELFGNGNGALRQPGTSQRLAAHGGIVSFAANYRTFAAHNSWVITFNTFIDNDETGGIRWIELRNDAVSDWSIFQEGTFSIADGQSRVMSSSAMDAQGNIALAYTVGSTTLAPSLRYTGRFDGDPLGLMTVTETTIINGPGVRTNSNRYGDYSHMTMDPNQFTFWFTSDYFSSNNQWRTQVAAFSLSGGFADDLGAIAIEQPSDGVLTNAETVEVTIRNFGTDPQSNFPIDLILDGNLIATETFTGTIPGSSIASYTFTETLDLSAQGATFEIEVSTDLTGDEFSPNNSVTKEVTNLFASDVGAVDILSPENGSGLGLQTVSAEIQNFGANPQSNFNVQYSVDGAAPIVENFTGTIASGESAVFDFAEQVDLTELGSYSISVSTALAGDEEPANNTVTEVVENILCMPSGNCNQGTGFRLVSVAEINNVSDCEGYGDFTDQIANLAAGSSNDITFRVLRGSQHIKVWIDFNDDFNFTNDEIVVPNFIIAPGEAAGDFTETVSLNVPASAPVGEHLMRVRSNFNAPVPNDACAIIQFGETEDYTANIGVLGVNDFEISNSDLIVTSLGNNQFDVSLQSSFDGTVYLAVYNVLGQQITFEKSVPKQGNTYQATLDMNNMSSGVYIIKVGGATSTTYKTARIIVN